jgi:hypothetical protein
MKHDSVNKMFSLHKFLKMKGGEKMKKTKILGVFFVCAIVLALIIGQAEALQVYGVDTAGNTTLLSTTWTPMNDVSLVDKSSGAGTDWEINLAPGDAGAAEMDSQASLVYQASTSISTANWAAIQVDFDFDAFTWDSYNIPPPDPLPGGDVGYWDLMGLTINQQGTYNAVKGTDPQLVPDPAGIIVIDSLAGGTILGWGGVDYAAGYFEEEHSSHSLVHQIVGDNPVVISAFLPGSSSPGTSYLHALRCRFSGSWYPEEKV